MSDVGAPVFFENSPSASLGDSMLPGMAEELDKMLEADGRSTAIAGETLGEYSGARFFSKNPASYKIVVRLLAEGLPVRAIGRVMGISAHLVEAVRAREAASMETQSYSRMLAGKVRGIMMQAADELRARLEDEDARAEMSTKDLIAAMDRLSGIERDLAGEPQNIQRVLRSEGADQRLVALLRGVGAVRDVEAVEVSGNGLGGENSSSRESERPRAAEDEEDGMNGGSTKDAAEDVALRASEGFGE